MTESMDGALGDVLEGVLKQVRVVLSHTSHPGNIGAAARAMKTMGLLDLRLVNPLRFPDEMAVAMSSGASDILDAAQISSTMEAALTGTVLVAACTARPRQLSHEALTVREGAALLAARAVHEPVALMFGTEMSGLSNAELDLCQVLMHIPANPGYSSLNLAAAVQVVAYELRQAASSLVPDSEATILLATKPLARHEEMERFYQELEQVLIEVDFLNPAMPRRLMVRMRRLFARAQPEREEFDMLMGVLKQVRKTAAMRQDVSGY